MAGPWSVRSCSFPPISCPCKLPALSIRLWEEKKTLAKSKGPIWPPMGACRIDQIPLQPFASRAQEAALLPRSSPSGLRSFFKGGIRCVRYLNLRTPIVLPVCSTVKLLGRVLDLEATVSRILLRASSRPRLVNERYLGLAHPVSARCTLQRRQLPGL